MIELDPEKLVFIDETGINRGMARRYARAPRGMRAFDHQPLKYGSNVSVVGAIRLDGVVTALSLEGATDGDVFLAFTERILGPKLRPGDVVIMDNLPAHKIKGIREAIEAAGAKLLYQPRYSPEFNPIEHCWSKLKEWLRGQAARTKEALDHALAQGLDLVTTKDLAGWFQHCGYGVLI